MTQGLGAFIRDWEPPQHSRTFLERYLQSDGKLQDVPPFKPTAGNDVYIDEIEVHFDRLKREIQNWSEPFVNLVFGNVQSGKTSHLRANICWARDNDFDLLILLTGSNTDLGDQTVDTLETKLPTGTIKLIKSPTEGSLTDDKKFEIRESVVRRIGNRNNPIPLISLIKSPKRLDAVKQIVEHLGNSSLPPLRVMFLDDEADQVSPDADANRRTEVESRNNNSNRSLRMSVHTRINEIRNAVNGLHIYLAYTATPQALFLGDLNSTMQPRFCSIVPPGSDYVGIGDIVRQQSTNRSTFFQITTDSSHVNDDQNYVALEKAFVTFVYLMWLHKHYPEIFHGADTVDNANCKSTSIQFLIHPSGKSDFHKEYSDAVEQLRRDFKRAMSEPGRDRTVFFDDFFIPTVKSIASRLPRSSDFLLKEENLRESWDYFFQVLDDENALHTRLVNHKERQRQQTESSSRRVSLVPISTEEWNVEGRDGWILVGGNILGRGLAIPHLVVTLFLRNPRHPNFDTAVQQMRFCGYRRSYLELIRIFAPTDIIEDYQTAVEIDAPFRNRALRWHRESRDLLKRPPIMRFVAPTSSRYRPTRNAVISARVSARTMTQSSGFFNLGLIANPGYFANNLDLIIDLAGDLNEVDRRLIGSNEVIYYSLSQKLRETLFSRFNVHGQEMKDFWALNELLDYSEAEKGLANVDHLLAVDKALIELNSSDNAFAMFNDSDLPSFGFRTLNQSAKAADWKGRNPSMALKHAAAKSIVGDSERKVHEQREDSVVIHARTFNLRNPESGSSIGLGLTLVGWIPSGEDDFQVYANDEAIYVN